MSVEQYLFRIGNTNVVKFYNQMEIARNTNAQFYSLTIFQSNPAYWFKLEGVNPNNVQIGDIIRLYGNSATANNGDYSIQHMFLPDGVNFNHTQYVVNRTLPDGNFNSNLKYKILSGGSSNSKIFTDTAARLLAQQINPGATTTLTITGLESGATSQIQINVFNDSTSISDPSDTQLHVGGASETPPSDTQLHVGGA